MIGTEPTSSDSMSRTKTQNKFITIELSHHKQSRNTVQMANLWPTFSLKNHPSKNN